MDEEDVILKTSPLYEYFKELAPDSENEVSSCINLRKEKVTFFGTILSVIQSVHYTIRGVIQYLFDACRSKVTSYLSVIWQQLFQSVFKNMVNSGLLIDEDTAFVQSFSADLCTRNSQEAPFEPLLLKCAVIPIFIVITYSAYNFQTTSFTYDIDADSCLNIVCKRLVIFILSFSIAFCGLLTVFHLCFKFSCYILHKQLSKLCPIVKDFNGIIRKSIKIIQEAELIARGFTFTKSINIVQRLELAALPVLTPDRQLPEFRKVLFTWMREIFLNYRESTNILIKQHPIPNDCMSQYFATMAIEEFGGLIEYNPDNEEGYDKLLQISDNLSLSSLKAVCQLTEVQISEFFRRFCLSILLVSDIENSSYFNLYEKNRAFMSVLKKLTINTKKIFLLLQQAYFHHKSIEKWEKVCDKKLLPKRSPIYDIRLSVHDMNLHLKAALTRVISMEDYLSAEQHNIENNQDYDIIQIEKACNDFQNVMEAELLANNNCFEQFCQNFDHLFPNTDDQETLVLPLCKNVTLSGDKKPVIIDNSDPVIEDEVFEAVIKECDISDLYEDFQEECFNNNKLDKTISAHLMRELKTVLVVKAEEHKTREKKVLLSKSYKQPGKATDGPFDTGSENNTIMDENLHDIFPLIASKEVDEINYMEHNKFCTDVQNCYETTETLSTYANNQTSTYHSHKDSSDELYSCDSVESTFSLRTDHNSSKVAHEQRQMLQEESFYHLTEDSDEDINSKEQDVLLKKVELSDTHMQFRRPVINSSLAASIAAMAAQRQKILSLETQTYDYMGDEVIGDDSDDS